MEFYLVVDRETTNPTMSNNGGDYTEGRTIAVQDGQPVAVRYWSSWDGGFCHKCGRYEPFKCNCNGIVTPRDWQNWQNGTLLTGTDVEVAQTRFDNDGFAMAIQLGWYNEMETARKLTNNQFRAARELRLAINQLTPVEIISAEL